jgi:hypothetical protein
MGLGNPSDIVYFPLLTFGKREETKERKGNATPYQTWELKKADDHLI